MKKLDKKIVKDLKIVGQLLFKMLIFVILPIAIFVMITSRWSVMGLRSFVVLTGSMEPKLPVGSLIFTIPQSNYYINDVITFKRGQVDITHRIAAASQSAGSTLYHTKGDANNGQDAQIVNKVQVLGRVVAVVPEIGKLTNFMKTVPGFVLIIVLPTLAFIFFEGKSLKTEWEKEIEKKLIKKLKEVENL